MHQLFITGHCLFPGCHYRPLSTVYGTYEELEQRGLAAPIHS